MGGKKGPRLVIGAVLLSAARGGQDYLSKERPSVLCCPRTYWYRPPPYYSKQWSRFHTIRKKNIMKVKKYSEKIRRAVRRCLVRQACSLNLDHICIMSYQSACFIMSVVSFPVLPLFPLWLPSGYYDHPGHLITIIPTQP